MAKAPEKKQAPQPPKKPPAPPTTDVVLLEGGIVRQVWRAAELAAIATQHPDLAANLRQAPYGVAVAGMLLTPSGAFAPAPAPAPTKGELLDRADAHFERVAAGGVTVNLAAEGEPALFVTVSTTLAGRVDLNGAVGLATANPDHVFDWVQAGGSLQLTADQMIRLGQLVALWGQSVYSALGAIRSQIESGQITTIAQLDAAGWPPNS